MSKTSTQTQQGAQSNPETTEQQAQPRAQDQSRGGEAEVGASEKSSEKVSNKKNGHSILLVEDEPLLGNLLERRLTEEGFEVRRADNGEKALEEVKEREPDLILLDIILPKTSGFEFMKEIREDPQVGDVPVVIISNLGQENDIQKGKKLGAVGYFVKAQLSIENLISQVEDFLEG